MADQDQSEKTEEPTAKRKETFREEGNIPQSRDIGGAAILAVTLLISIWSGPRMVELLASLFRTSFEHAATVPGEDMWSVTAAAVHDVGRTFLGTVGVIGAASAVVAVLAGVAQTGGNVSFKPLEPKAEKFDPIKNLQNKIFSTQALVQLGLQVLKAAVLGAVLWAVLRGSLDELATLPSLPLEASMVILGRVFLRLVLVGIFAAATLAAIDYAVTRYRIHEQMKMTKQEIKDEHKNQEGDPQVKGRMRARMRQIGQNRMMAAAAEADLVVVNPTHYAVAIAYDVDSDRAPVLLAKGKDKLAFKIRETARAHTIPIIANPPVARAVYEHGRVGQEIPGELYEMVARVLAYLYRMTRRTAA